MNPSPELRRDISLWSMFSLSFGAIIGVGWIVMLGGWIAAAGSIGATIAFLLGGLVIAMIAVAYGEASAAYPASGGDIVFVYHTFGVGAAFAVGWLLLLIYISVNGFLSVSAGWIVTELLRQDVAGVPITPAGERAIAIIGIVALAVINAVGARFATAFQTAATALLVLTSLLFVVASLVNGDFRNLQPYFANLNASAFDGVMSVFITTPLWYAGFNVVPQAMGERAGGVTPRQVVGAMILGVLGAIAFYAAVIVSAAMAMPREELLASSLPAAVAFSRAFGAPLLGKAALFAGLLGLVTSWNAVFFAGARVLFALGRARLLPQVFSSVSKRSGAPVNALAFITAASAGLVLLGRDNIANLANVSGIGFTLLFLCASISALKLRMRARGRGGALSFLMIVFAALASAAIAAIALWGARPAAQSPLSIEWLILLLWAGLGALLWIMLGAYRSQMPDRQRGEVLLSAIG